MKNEDMLGGNPCNDKRYFGKNKIHKKSTDLEGLAFDKTVTQKRKTDQLFIWENSRESQEIKIPKMNGAGNTDIIGACLKAKKNLMITNIQNIYLTLEL